MLNLYPKGRFHSFPYNYLSVDYILHFEHADLVYRARFLTVRNLLQSRITASTIRYINENCRSETETGSPQTR